MGWFTERANNKKHAASESATELVENSLEAVKRLGKNTKNLPKNTFDKFLNGKLRKGNCMGCGRPITKDAYFHKKCSRSASEAYQDIVNRFQSIHDIAQTNHCQTCGLNTATANAYKNSCCPR